MKIMKILEFHLRESGNHENLRISVENYEKYENLRILFDNHEKHENI